VAKRPRTDTSTPHWGLDPRGRRRTRADPGNLAYLRQSNDLVLFV
jgi:hypothetical protein